LLNSIPDALSGFHNLVSLNLSNNLITSVRGAHTALGNIHTINLARNRIDCLVGLDRVLGLRRVDIRANALAEAGEVGRLAVLPHVKAVWAAENPLTLDEDWRAQIGACFVAEERTVVLDDMPLAWSEQRRVDAILASRGRVRKEPNERDQAGSPERPPPDSAPTSPDPNVRSSTASPTPPNVSVSVTGSPNPNTNNTGNPLIPTPAGRVLSPMPSPAKTAAVHRKRPRRRVVNLDGDPEDSPGSASAGGTPGGTPAKPKGSKKKEGKGHKRRESRMSNGAAAHTVA
jgi:hypothetical protein